MVGGGGGSVSSVRVELDVEVKTFAMQRAVKVVCFLPSAEVTKFLGGEYKCLHLHMLGR